MALASQTPVGPTHKSTSREAFLNAAGGVLSGLVTSIFTLVTGMMERSLALAVLATAGTAIGVTMYLVVRRRLGPDTSASPPASVPEPPASPRPIVGTVLGIALTLLIGGSLCVLVVEPLVSVPAAAKNWRDFLWSGIAYAAMAAALIWPMIFGVLQRWGPLRETRRHEYRELGSLVNAVLALVATVAVCVLHLTGSFNPDYDPVLAISEFIPTVVVILVVVGIVLGATRFSGLRLDPRFRRVFLYAVIGILAFKATTIAPPRAFYSLRFLRDPAIEILTLTLLTMGLVGWAWIREPRGD